ncbi:hypothetical protein MFLAVUS_005885 [Mucor flavus]|uniref:Uncharacterized protein n=1 Tax=Mucor flavus TaxID=439312 RepID=A0ABP9YZZ2_9FUNG
MSISDLLEFATSFPSEAAEELRQELERRKKFEIQFAAKNKISQNCANIIMDSIHDWNKQTLTKKETKKVPLTYIREKFTSEEVLSSYKSLNEEEKHEYEKRSKSETGSICTEFDFDLGLNSVVDTMRTLALAGGYSSVFLYWQRNHSVPKINVRYSGPSSAEFSSELVRSKLFETYISSIKKDISYKKICPAHDTIKKNNNNKVAAHEKVLALFQRETGEVRKNIPWEKIKKDEGTIKVVGWPSEVPLAAPSQMHLGPVGLLLKAIDDGNVHFSCRG